jgi:hypothetical protein
MDDIEIHGLHAGRTEQVLGSHEEILGAAMEILGVGASSTALKSSPAFKEALARQLARRAPVVRQVAPTKKRRWPIAFGPTGIPPNTTVTLTASPQVLYRGEKLVNTGDATNLYISGMFVGNKPQLPSLGNSVSVSAFANTVLDNEMQFDTCDPALSITIQVQNIGATTYTASLTLFGHAVQ